ncbi:MAG: FliM/FliN family flagellar motor switch protein [Reinekea sp.]
MTAVKRLRLPQLSQVQVILNNLLNSRDAAAPVVIDDLPLTVKLWQRRPVSAKLSIGLRSQGENSWLMLEEEAISKLLGPEQDATIYPDDFLFAILKVKLHEPLQHAFAAFGLELDTLTISREIPDLIEGPVLCVSVGDEQGTGFAALHPSSTLIKRLITFLKHQPTRITGLADNLPIAVEIKIGSQLLSLRDIHGLKQGDILMLSPAINISRPLLRIPGYGAYQTELTNSSIIVVSNMIPEDSFLPETHIEETSLSQLELSVDFQLGSIQMTLEELSSLAEGSTFDLGTLNRAPVSVKVNNQIIAHCELVEIEGHLGARIMSMAGNPDLTLESYDD